MKNGVFYLMALMVCALGMTACTNGKNDGGGMRQEGSAQEIPETVREEETQEPEGGQEGSGQEIPETVREEEPQEPEGGQEGSGQEIPETVREEEPQEPEGGQEGSAQETDTIQTESGLAIRFDEAEQNYAAEDGTPLLIVQIRFPVVTIPGHEQAAEAINRYVRGGQVFPGESLTGPPVEEMLTWAEEDYKARGKDMWPAAYQMYEGYWLGRLDESVVSLGLESFSYAGGAHPNTVLRGFVFDTQTGERLSFADVAEDADAASEAVVRFLLEETAKLDENMDSASFFDGYEETLESYPKEDKWYLGEDGFHILIDTYEIAPYVAGNFDFVIPYGEADFLKEKYVK